MLLKIEKCRDQICCKLNDEDDLEGIWSEEGYLESNKGIQNEEIGGVG